ncbi:MAG: hypothetical protein AAF654_04755 [Myxococcota bacterium]
MTIMNAARLASIGILALTAACAQQRIAGTNVEDTEEHRELFDIVMRYRAAMEARDAKTILGLVSTSYYEDNGNADPSDDYGYTQLRDQILPETMDVTKEVFLTLEVQEIVVDDDVAHVDVRFNQRARIEMPSGSSWDTQRELNRIDFRREDQGWRIVRGL